MACTNALVFILSRGRHKFVVPIGRPAAWYYSLDSALPQWHSFVFVILSFCLLVLTDTVVSVQ